LTCCESSYIIYFNMSKNAVPVYNNLCTCGEYRNRTDDLPDYYSRTALPLSYFPINYLFQNTIQYVH